MTLSPDDLAAMGERHRAMPAKDVWGRDITICAAADGQSWPCDSRRLLDEVEALRSVLSEIAAGPYNGFEQCKAIARGALSPSDTG